jgi:NAD(P)-dependent dehydrogenase (short-subunit alcohol dehydrogenase family)
MKLDQGDFASVSAFVSEFEKQHERLDVLVANAGICTSTYEATKDGWEST